MLIRMRSLKDKLAAQEKFEKAVSKPENQKSEPKRSEAKIKNKNKSK